MAAAPPLAPTVRKYEGANGITVLHQGNPFSRAFCIGVWLNVGSRDEVRGEEGICHFLEHMLFKGTSHRSALEISQTIEKVGGSLDAFTTKEQVCFYVQVLDDHKDLAIDVLSDMLLNATYPQEQVALERQVVLEEIEDVMDAPDDLIHDLFAPAVFPNHPLGRPILGTPTTVSRFTREKLLRFARKTLRASNVMVAVVGDLDKRQLGRIRERAFRLPAGKARRSNGRMRRYQPIRRFYGRELHHQHICIGQRAYSLLDGKRFPLMVLATLLGDGMSSRLFQRIREEKGFAYSVFTYTEAARDTGLLGTYMAVKPANAGAAVREVFKEFAAVKRGDFTRSELEDTKEQLKGKILLGLESTYARMMRMARNDIYYGRQIPERELIRRIDRVGREDVLMIASELLDVGRNTIVSLGPTSAGVRISRV